MCPAQLSKLHREIINKRVKLGEDDFKAFLDCKEILIISLFYRLQFLWLF